MWGLGSAALLLGQDWMGLYSGELRRDRRECFDEQVERNNEGQSEQPQWGTAKAKVQAPRCGG